jgi:TctA family transporter
MVEQAFVTSLIKSDGSILPFFERPVSAVLAASTIAAFRLAGVRVGKAEDGV